MSKTKFYICDKCGETLIGDISSTINCCGGEVKQVLPNVTDAAKQKHIPKVDVNGDDVQVVVGEIEHPMTDEHSIQFIYLETEKGGQMKKLNVDDGVKVDFTLNNDKLIAVYAYCNLHGLWSVSL